MLFQVSWVLLTQSFFFFLSNTVFDLCPSNCQHTLKISVVFPHYKSRTYSLWKIRKRRWAEIKKILNPPKYHLEITIVNTLMRILQDILTDTCFHFNKTEIALYPLFYFLFTHNMYKGHFCPCQLIFIYIDSKNISFGDWIVFSQGMDVAWLIQPVPL